MSRISYFQRFSQRENHATNNTLLLLRYFHEESPHKLQKVLNSWIDVPVELGLTFQQQVRRAASVPDGLIEQAPLSIYFETKLGSEVWRDQIERHIQGIAGDATTKRTVMLVGLTREPSPEAEETELQQFAEAKQVIYRGLTFSSVLEDLRAACAPHDEDLLRILDDYQDFLESQGLLDSRGKRMAVIPCGRSFVENLEFGLYYDPPSRPCRRGAGLLGVYRNKAILAVGKVAAIGIFSFEGGRIAAVEHELGKTTDAQCERLLRCIEKTRYYTLGKDDLRVYFVDRFEQTDLRKVSPGGVLGVRYLSVDELMADGAYRSNMTTQEIANALRGRMFG